MAEWVAYAPPGIDAPLAVRARTERVGVAADIIPLANWRGLYDAGVFPDGSTVRDGLNLKLVEWAGRNYRAFFDRIPDPANPEPVWLGSLMSHKRDASGQLYMRNRYLDPTSGRFTQEDPIGMAGGLNLYGFGGGDPVNYSDPYGLCPPWPRCLVLAGGAAVADGPLPNGDVVAVGLLTIGVIHVLTADTAASRTRATPITATLEDTRNRRDDNTVVRIQAQGGGLERSIVLQNPTAADGLAAWQPKPHSRRGSRTKGRVLLPERLGSSRTRPRAAG